ncbi:hypothetical protein CHU_1635 [Sporocytophaga myxococcoides]|uniref:Bacteroidetes-specific membrane protein n=1 Tax=Sporocytophaga myxococcoides TaxID=153721 RepID=A0A098LI83_9BACT|nr:type IX secretion system membrane protein PorP/SprF [Sporocytophaga myxococcoides]GAL86685.1 hypothetical protein CHU_1635 [Sporocytophaga myxococcoides]
MILGGSIRSLYILLLCWMFNLNYCSSQDIQYSQFYANVLYLNPAFAGNAHALRGIYHQRVQWPALNAKYITSHFSIDNYFNKANSGVGFMVYKDWQGASTIASTEAAFQYAYELHLTQQHSFRAGIQTSYVSRYIDYSGLYFPDQYDSYGYLGKQTSQPFQNDQVQYLDFSSGGIFYSDHYWIGATYAHMNRPNQSFYGEDSRLPYKLDFIAGYRLDIETRNVNKEINQGRDIYITPTAHYKSQGKSDQIDLGVYFLYDHLITGLWYRGIPLLKHYRWQLQNNESMVILAGWRVNGLSISYSFDHTVSKLAPAHTGGSHELNITYLYELTRKRKKIIKKIPCPHFYQ